MTALFVTVQQKNRHLHQTLYNVNKEKALVVTFLGHCETSRRFVDSSTRSSTLLHTVAQYRAALHYTAAVTLNLSIKMCHILALVHQHCHRGRGDRSCPACTHHLLCHVNPESIYHIFIYFLKRIINDVEVPAQHIFHHLQNHGPPTAITVETSFIGDPYQNI